MIDRLVGHAVATFDAPSAGAYVVSSATGEPGARIADGGDIGTTTVVFVLAVIAAILDALVALVAFAFRSPRGARSPGSWGTNG